MGGVKYKYAPDWAKYDPRFYGAFAAASSGTVNTAALQAAIDAAGTAGGGIVQVPEGVFTIRQIVLKGHVQLRGAGHLATRLILESGQNKHAIINHVSTNGTTDPNALYCTVADLCIDGNKANNTSGDGIYLTRNPAYAPATNDEGGDSDLAWENQATIERVMVLRAKNNGFESSNIGSVRLTNCWAEHCDGHGFALGFDSMALQCVASNSGLNGFGIYAPSSHLVGCKSYYSGQLATGNGYEMAGYHLDSVAHVTMVGCEAQDNKGPGWLLDSSYGAIIQGGMADSNSTYGVGSFPGVWIYAGYNNIVDVACTERRANGTNSFQQNAVKLESGTYGNNVTLSHWAETWNSATVGTAIMSGSTVSGNTVVVNNQLGSQAITYASTITPDPYAGGKVIVGTLTGNITDLAAPSNAHIGCRLSFKFTQDATGSRTVGWNATYKKSWTISPTANKISTIEFEYDGTNWIQVGGTVGI